MSDALRSNVFCRYTPEAIACACIFLSARVLKIPLPNSPPWYIALDATEEMIVDICENILTLYERPKVKIIKYFKLFHCVHLKLCDASTLMLIVLSIFRLITNN